MKTLHLAVGLLGLGIQCLHAGVPFTVIMSGLDNPRGLTLGVDGGIYVAEAGRGGDGTGVLSGNGQMVQYGASGAVSRYFNGVQERVITGLPSLAPQSGPMPGDEAIGLHDLAFFGGELFGVIGLGGNPANAGLLAGDSSSFAHLVRLPLGGSPENIADLGAFEALNNPDGGVPDTNPYALLTTAAGFVVADAGANALLSITPDGNISTLSVFPPQPNPLPFGPPLFEAVPTTVALGPDSLYYVGNLTGFPFPEGYASIWGIDPATGDILSTELDFTTIIDLGFTSDGDLLVLQLTSNGLASMAGPGPGRLIRIDRETGARYTLIDDPLFFPGGLLIGPGDAIYVSNLGVSAGQGEVWAIVPESRTTGLLVGTLALIVWRHVARRRNRPAD